MKTLMQRENLSLAPEALKISNCQFIHAKRKTSKNLGVLDKILRWTKTI